MTFDCVRHSLISKGSSAGSSLMFGQLQVGSSGTSISNLQLTSDHFSFCSSPPTSEGVCWKSENGKKKMKEGIPFKRSKHSYQANWDTDNNHWTLFKPSRWQFTVRKSPFTIWEIAMSSLEISNSSEQLYSQLRTSQYSSRTLIYVCILRSLLTRFPLQRRYITLIIKIIYSTKQSVPLIIIAFFSTLRYICNTPGADGQVEKSIKYRWTAAARPEGW